MNGQLEFFGVDDMEPYRAAEHFMCTNVEWDPTGRYVATSVTSIHQMENGFNNLALQWHAPLQVSRPHWNAKNNLLVSLAKGLLGMGPMGLLIVSICRREQQCKRLGVPVSSFHPLSPRR